MAFSMGFYGGSMGVLWGFYGVFCSLNDSYFRLLHQG